MSMSKSEAGKLGYEKTKLIHAANYQKRVDEYNLNPIKCKCCNKPLSYKENKLKKVFCNSVCAATYNNQDRKIYVPCKNCNTPLPGHDRVYCNTQCMKDFRLKQHLNDINNKVPRKLGKNTLKRLLTELFGYKCSICNISEWNNKKLVLELEHKDGHSDNNELENLCLICPNCHSQTPTYKGKNKGNGRHFRRIRYAEGKSY